MTTLPCCLSITRETIYRGKFCRTHDVRKLVQEQRKRFGLITDEIFEKVKSSEQREKAGNADVKGLLETLLTMLESDQNAQTIRSCEIHTD